MSKLLYIQASPRGERSYSVSVAQEFIDSYKVSHPQDVISVLDVFQANLPPFDGLAVQAKYTILHGLKHSPEELEAWRAVEAVIEEFKSADKYVLAVPMWNFGIPYRLKQYFDILVQPGYTFSFSPEAGYQGLVSGKPIVLFCSRGGAYPAGSPAESFDLQKRYLELILGFMGFSDIRSVVVEPTLQDGPQIAAKAREEAVVRARGMATTF
jgi:FMN-dependent NADH-azoreductase